MMKTLTKARTQPRRTARDQARKPAENADASQDSKAARDLWRELSSAEHVLPHTPTLRRFHD